jgi:hypothetical protein
MNGSKRFHVMRVINTCRNQEIYHNSSVKSGEEREKGIQNLGTLGTSWNRIHGNERKTLKVVLKVE